MHQNIFYEAPTTLRNNEKWFGEMSVQRMLDITDILHAFFDQSKPGINYTYQCRWVHQKFSDSGFCYSGRVLTNLIVGCPIFYPIRNVKVEANKTYGFTPIVLDEMALARYTQEIDAAKKMFPPDAFALKPAGMQAKSIYAQYIYTMQTLRPEYIIKKFGRGAYELGKSFDEILSGNSQTEYFPSYEWMYAPYLVRQYSKNNSLYYEGLAYTNLVGGMPIFYPLYQKDFVANKAGGFKTLRLPDDVLDEIKSLDYCGCRLSPPADIAYA